MIGQVFFVAMFFCIEAILLSKDEYFTKLHQCKFFFHAHAME